MNNTSMYIYELILQYNGNINAHVRATLIRVAWLRMLALREGKCKLWPLE